MAGSRGGTHGQLRVYRCQGRHGGRKCPAPSMIVAEPLEAFVLEQVRELLAGDTVRGERAAGTPELGALAEALRTAEAELDAFMLDLANRSRYGDRYETYLDARLRAVEEAENAYRSAASSLGPLAACAQDGRATPAG